MARPNQPIAVFHPGVQHSWQTALALQQLGRLAWYATSIFYRPERWPYRIERHLPARLAEKVHAEWRRFDFPALAPELVRTHGWHEWAERLAIRLGRRGLGEALDLRGNFKFANYLARDIRSDAPFALWGYNSSALRAFTLARDEGRTCVLDRTIGDHRAYNREMVHLQDRYGDWFTAREGAIPKRVIETEAQEHALADRILVGCEFAARTVREFAENPAIADKVEVLDYCFDQRLFAGLPAPRPAISGPVRFLFLGLAIPRKGIQHVLEAIARFPASQASLTVVGKLGIPEQVFARYADRVDYRPTVPRGDVPGIMAAHDVLLFPSYFEGAGLVLYEALAAGLALIQSDRAAIAVTPDTGVLLKQPSTDALCVAMESAIADRARLAHWRTHAQVSSQAWTFNGYVRRIEALLYRLGI